jgi:hypothetical protein
MGSLLSSSYATQDTINDVIQIVEELINDYKFWGKPAICDKLVKILPGKIILFNKLKKGIGYAVKLDDELTDEQRTELCDELLTHYKKRLGLMEFILSSINRSMEINTKIKRGDVLSTFDECEKFGGIWLDKISYKNFVNKISNDKVLSNRTQILKDLDITYNKNLKILQSVLTKLKNDIHENSISDLHYDIIQNMAIERARRLVYVSQIYFLMGVNLVLF